MSTILSSVSTRETTISAVVTRADGKTENLGVVSFKSKQASPSLAGKIVRAIKTAFRR